MKKELYLTFDCEVWSKNKNLHYDFFKPTLTIANFFEEEKIPVTLFISLSRKFPEIINFYEKLDELLNKINSYEYISIQPHLHFFDLPIKGLNTPYDTMDKYTTVEANKAIRWAISLLKRYNIEATIFRPAGYFRSKEYYQILKENELQSSNLRENNENKENEISTFNSYNRKLKPLNSIITPEIIPANKVHKEFQKNKSTRLVSNFHSFSVYNATLLSWHPCSIIKIFHKLRKKIFKTNSESYEWKQMKKFIKKYRNYYIFKNF